MLLTGYLLLLTLTWIGATIYLLINSRKVTYLKDVVLPAPMEEPAVAIIIGVKDEEAEVEKALTSVCQLDYANASIIVINDRSTDRTPEILQKIAASNSTISVLTIQELPEGWLGKNHALYQGYKATSTQWMLFTDADVLFHKPALKKAIHFATQKQLDHLVVLPEITSPSALFKSVMKTFSIMLEIRQRPWDVSNPETDASIGVGAFNLVKRHAYEKIGTHSAFSLRPDDDLKLGERIKAAGLKQDVVYGEGEISLAWYATLNEFIRGLMKNTFSVFNYHLPTALAMAVATLLVFVIPVPLAVISGKSGWAMAIGILTAQIILMVGKSGIHGKWWHALLIPFAGLVMVYIIAKSAILTLQQGGIYWRNSFYSLKELRKQI